MAHIPTLSRGKKCPVGLCLAKPAWKCEEVRSQARCQFGFEAHERYNEPFYADKFSRLLINRLLESRSSARSISS
jgi:hypothetical protein